MEKNRPAHDATAHDTRAALELPPHVEIALDPASSPAAKAALARSQAGQTLGEYRVGITFNPSGSGDVHRLKTLAAAFIDAINGVDDGALPGESMDEHRSHERINEIRRLKALAMTAAEDAAMWAVKAATKPVRDAKPRETTWQERLEAEFQDLDTKCRKLYAFLDDHFKPEGFPSHEMDRLKAQYEVMCEYRNILQQRLVDIE